MTRPYTEADHARINELRFAGTSWPEIARQIDRADSRWAANNVRQHAKDAGLACYGWRPSMPEPERRSIERAEAGWEPLPAMHPLSWGAINGA